MEEKGRWITLENGTHLFIRDGQSIPDAIKEKIKWEQKNRK